MNKKILSVLAELEKTRTKFWNISPETGLFLNQLIRFQKIKTILEIGTSNGYSGIWLAEALMETGGHLHTIESNFKKRFDLGTSNFKKAGVSDVITQIKGHAPEAIPSTPKTLDLAFFDATKHEHLEYFHVLENRINKNGMIITDNAISHKKELAPYTKHLQKQKNWSSKLLGVGTGLFISTKIR